MRDIPGFVNSRRRILELRPTIRASWVAFAVANFANHDFELAHEVTVKYFETRNDLPEAYEESEFLLFQVSCLEKLEKFSDAKTRLLEVKNSIIDGLSYRIKMATLHLYSGDYENAISDFTQLLVEQTENFHFHRGLQIALLRLSYPQSQSLLSLKRQSLPCSVLTLTTENVEILLHFYSHNGPKKSRVFAKIRLFLLQFLPDFSSILSSDGDVEKSSFFVALEEFIVKNTNDGFPALGHDILFLASSSTPSSAQEAQQDAIDLKNHSVIKFTMLIISRLLTQLRNPKILDSQNPDSNLDSPENLDFASSKSPQMEFWLLYLQAHLYLKMNMLSDAETAIQLAESHTPTALDLYTRKSRLMKLQGDVSSAAQCMDQNRSLDLQDRFLNNKSTKYFLRNDQLQLANETIAMFTKHDAVDVDKTLVDLQVTWFELESGESAVRLKKYGLALRRFYSIKKHFADQFDDLFDFHGYCYRKTTLRAYLDTLRNLDAYYANPTYLRAMRDCLGLFGYLLDNPEDIDGLGHLSAADRKKERAKLKKLKMKNETTTTSTTTTAGGDEETEKKENSVEKEEEMLLTKDFLQESSTWTNPILANDDLLRAIEEDSLAIIAEFAIRRGRYLHALRAINFALAKHEGVATTFHPEVTLVIIKLAVKMKAKKLGTTASPLVLATLRTEMARLLGGGESASYLNEYLANYLQFVAEHPSILYVLSAVKCVQLVEKNAVQCAEKVKEIVSRENVLDKDQCRGLLYKHLAELVKVHLQYINSNYFLMFSLFFSFCKDSLPMNPL